MGPGSKCCFVQAEWKKKNKKSNFKPSLIVNGRHGTLLPLDRVAEATNHWTNNKNERHWYQTWTNQRDRYWQKPRSTTWSFSDGSQHQPSRSTFSDNDLGVWLSGSLNLSPRTVLHHCQLSTLSGQRSATYLKPITSCISSRMEKLRPEEVTFATLLLGGRVTEECGGLTREGLEVLENVWKVKGDEGLTAAYGEGGS